MAKEPKPNETSSTILNKLANKL